MGTTMTPAVADKLLEWERRRDGGTPVTPEELCADWPEGLAEVRRRIRELEACDRLLGFGDDPEATGGWAGGPADGLPDRVAGFEIRGRLGRGGMGDVYDGWDPVLERAVAVKVMRASPAYRPLVRDEELAGRLVREGAALARLDHPHIVPVYQAGVSDGRAYLAMARVRGGPLSDRAGQLSRQGPRAVAAFIEKVARAVHAAHERGVLHRDLKPGNILVDADGEPRVADFGLAKLWAAEEPADAAATSVTGRADGLTFPGIQPGTPAYMAPEQFDPARGEIGPATDVWALGIVVYELLTGARPFAGEEHRQLAEQVCRAPAPPARAAGRRVPRWLDAVVARCLAKAPGDRYRSAIELAEALRQGLRRGRRQAWAIGTVGVLGLALAGGFLVGQFMRGTSVNQSGVEDTPFEDLPEVAEALGLLGEGREATLVDRTRRPPHRFVWPERTGAQTVAPDGHLSFYSQSPDPTLIEFLPRLPPGRTRVRAELRHDTAGDSSYVAVYADGRLAADGRRFTCVQLSFSDVGPRALLPPNKDNPGLAEGLLEFVQLVYRRNPEEKGRRAGRGIVRFSSAARDGRRPGFRVVELELDGTTVRGFWGSDRESVGSGEQPAGEQFWAGHASPGPDVSWGGVGVIVYNGQVSVGSLTVTPIRP